MSTSIPNRTAAMSDARYRPNVWNDISKPGAPVVGHGLDERQAGARHYKPVGWQGGHAPFKTPEEAKAKCAQLNAAARQAVG